MEIGVLISMVAMIFFIPIKIKKISGISDFYDFSYKRVSLDEYKLKNMN